MSIFQPIKLLSVELKVEILQDVDSLSVSYINFFLFHGFWMDFQSHDFFLLVLNHRYKPNKFTTNTLIFLALDFGRSLWLLAKLNLLIMNLLGNIVFNNSFGMLALNVILDIFIFILFKLFILQDIVLGFHHFVFIVFLPLVSINFLDWFASLIWFLISLN